MKAIFLRALEETEDKSRVVRGAITCPERALGHSRFEVDPRTFRQVPRSPFAYWVSDRVRAIFSDLPPFEAEERTATRGASTCDDFRYLRLWTEATPSRPAPMRWVPFTKGGRFSRFYSDIPAVVDWDEARRTFRGFIGRPGRWLEKPEAVDQYFRAALTWPLRGITFSAQAVPRGCIFSVGGKVALVPEELLPNFLALFNSSALDALIRLFAGKVGGVQYEVGLIQSLPVPVSGLCSSGRLAQLACEGWTERRAIDTARETSHAFLLPALLQAAESALAARMLAWERRVAEVDMKLAAFESQIDEICFGLYAIDGADREQIKCGLGGGVELSDIGEAEEVDESGSPDTDSIPLVASLLSWVVGVSFGRFDLRLATGDRAAPPEPGPFDSLPVCSPGMLTGDDGLSLDVPPAGYAIDFPLDGILVDDAGADCDLVARARQVFELLFDDPAARWEEAADILGDRDRFLRGWFAREFFELHIKRYSKSRRKAPIYWQLATPSASYSAWLYYHRFTRDTLFRLVNDHVAPKLQHEERKLTNLTQDTGSNPTASQRKEIDAQESFVGELRAFRDEVARVAPLWNPNLNDGVILNFAPLWRLVPQQKAWQRECKSAWDKLCKGDYDWAHLAIHLWPERVVPKCARDRSLAIAHGLEDVFWYEDEDGRWQQKTIREEQVEALVAERTSSAVKGALKSLLDAPAPAAGRGRAPRRRKTTTRRAVPAKQSASAEDCSEEPRQSAPRQTSATAIVDSTVLDQIRSAIAALGGNAAKSDILDTAKLSASQWPPAINALLGDGSVTKTGQRRGTRYHLAQDPN